MTDEVLVKEIAEVIAHHHPDYTDEEIARHVVKRVRQETPIPPRSRLFWEANRYIYFGGPFPSFDDEGMSTSIK